VQMAPLLAAWLERVDSFANRDLAETVEAWFAEVLPVLAAWLELMDSFANRDLAGTVEA